MLGRYQIGRWNTKISGKSMRCECLKGGYKSRLLNIRNMSSAFNQCKLISNMFHHVPSQNSISFSPWLFTYI